MAKYLLIAAVTAAAITTLSSSIIWAASYSGRQIVVTQADSRPCVFFQLSGVIEADPVLAGNPWFALPKSNPSFSEMYAELLSAKISGKGVSAYTDGTTSCGYATASLIQLDP